ncbi:MAG: ABC transporter ATP-binding protein [Candidatus Tenebribacter davisii]|nr:ABC transporter ATP-binding protein [Candidatus Tenebribacter davisii]
MLEIKNVSFRYHETSVNLINNFTFSADNKDIIAIQGDSGSGKTTLLNIICGVIPKIFNGDLSGNIIHNEVDISNLTLPEIAPRISLLMQHPDNQLFFPTVEQELAFGPENLKIPTNDIIKRIDEVLNRLNIKDLRLKETSALSFGQKKLVSLASIITLSPDIFLLDEPFAGLSNEYIKVISTEIKTQAENGKIIFIAGHNININEFANKTIEMENLNERY